MTVIQGARVDTEEEILGLYRAHLSKGRATLAELFGSHMEVESSGAWLTTSDGERFLNAGGYGVFIMGARHPLVMEEVERQLHTHPTATRILLEPTVARAAEALVSVMPEGLDRVHFALSGAEAVETGLKLARAGGRRRIVSMLGGYHGKTLGALSATAKEVYQAPFRPLVPDVRHLPFGDAEALEAELRAHPGEVCVILEPVQGGGGVIIPPPGYLGRVAELVRAYDGFLVLDEVQTGFGRLGEWWGADAEGVVPDVLLTGKALGGGVLPVSAAVATREAFRPFDKDPYVHTATFSGQPLLMAAVQGAVRAVKEERLVSRARDLGAVLLSCPGLRPGPAARRPPGPPAGPFRTARPGRRPRGGRRRRTRPGHLGRRPRRRGARLCRRRARHRGGAAPGAAGEPRLGVPAAAADAAAQHARRADRHRVRGHRPQPGGGHRLRVRRERHRHRPRPPRPRPLRHRRHGRQRGDDHPAGDGRIRQDGRPVAARRRPGHRLPALRRRP
ncbi:ornithine aminotransferase [Streptomyces sparsogenes DSM 40356]|uniref:Ornithine aminotransferase n=1 Tax=Streptomyces sparsogenes DSM 40356 TaxID=1331668 RepID=A0A1R1SDF2_9ACTN|nr:ornithine aminotransferase [Streptomyces sparsogenes DSM 40356]